MDNDKPRPTPPKRGRPATGSDPVRTVRVGAVWDEARDVMRERGDSMAAEITRCLTRYVARHKTDT